MRAKVVVIGGGIMGLSIAWHLALELDPIDEPVVLLERMELGAGSSGRSGAILRQHYSDRELAAMARDSLKFYAGFQARIGTGIGFRRCGALTIAGPSDRELLERLRQNVAMQQQIGIRTELLEAEEIVRRFPGLRAQPGTLAAYEPDAGFVDPLRTVQAFGAQARFRGATTRAGCAALGVDVEHGRVARVQTSAGPIETRIAVVAAGPWTKRWLDRLGIELPLRCVKPEQAFVQGTKSRGPAPTQAFGSAPEAQGTLEERFGAQESADEPVAHPVLLDLEHGYYARCQPESDRTRIGEMDYHGCEELADPDRFSDGVRESFCGWARAALTKRVEEYAQRPDAGAQAAMYTLTPDAQAVMGALEEVEGLFVCSGFSGHGFKLAPSVGLGMAQMVRGQPVSAFDTEFFSPSRFAAGKVDPSRVRAFGL